MSDGVRNVKWGKILKTYELNLLAECETFEAFTAVKIHVDVFWVVTPCSAVLGYQHFGGPSCLHLQDDIPTTTLHVVTTQKTPI